MADSTNSSCRKGFGTAIARWLTENTWPQRICEDWSKAANNNVPGPWASQISQVIHCRLDPRTVFFTSLGTFNKRVHEGDFSDCRHDTRLYNKLRHIEREELENGRIVPTKAFTLDSGLPCNASDFFSIYIGELSVPEKYRLSKFGEEEINRMFTIVNEQIEQACLLTFRPKAEIYEAMNAEVWERNGEFGEFQKRLALGLEKPDADKLIRLAKTGAFDPQEGCPVLSFLREMLVESKADEKQLSNADAARAEVNSLMALIPA
jgi:hypothetical protein